MEVGSMHHDALLDLLRSLESSYGLDRVGYIARILRYAHMNY